MTPRNEDLAPQTAGQGRYISDERVRMAAFRHLAPTEAVDDPMLDRIVKLAALLTGSRHAGLHFIDESSQHRVAATGAPVVAWPRQDSMCRVVVEAHEPIEVEDATLDGRFGHSSFVQGDSPVRYYASHPIVAGDVAVIGTVCAWDSNPRKTSAKTLEALGHLAALAEGRLESLRLNRVLAEAAVTDPLTGLGNRRILVDSLERALAAKARHDRDVSVLFIDLDEFKHINDTLGHDAGDDVLAEVARRLEGARRETDLLARVGGDEFVLMLDEADEVAARITANRLAVEIGKPVTTAAGATRVTASVGVATARPDDTPDGLVRRADLDMYRAKNAARAAER